MEQEDKELLLRDLCARLSYGVKVKFNNIHILRLGTHTRVGEYVTDVTEPCKPYLFPMSSMTEEQYKTYCELEHSGNMEHLSLPLLEWLNKNHFDYRGLIPMGLALDATNLNIY